MARPGGVLLPPGVGLPPLALVEKERGEGGRGPTLASSPLFHLGPLRPIKLPGGSGNLPVLR